MVPGIGLYALLEFVSLLYVHLILKWKFHLSALHHLAFVLENERLLLNDMLMGCVVIMLQLMLGHYGESVDFLLGFCTSAWVTESKRCDN